MAHTPDDEVNPNQQECCVCHAVSPITETNYTLISPKHQWRMQLRTGSDGQKEPLWYCPTCWEVVKRVRSTSSKKSSDPR